MPLHTRLLTIIGALLLSGPVIRAQKPVTVGSVTRASGTIQEIDASSRTITVKNDQGEEEVFAAGDAIQRFNELKVGDRINVTYYESMVFQLERPGAAPASRAIPETATRGQGSLPSGTISRQKKTTVTIKTINPAIPSVTVTTADGRTVTRKVDNPKNLDGVKAGDRVEITYTEALLASVERSK